MGGMYSIVNAAKGCYSYNPPLPAGTPRKPCSLPAMLPVTRVPSVCVCLLVRVPVQRSAIDSCSNYVRCNLLKLLTIVTESGPSGFETVTNALDHVKVRKPAGAAIERCLTRNGGGGGGGPGAYSVWRVRVVCGGKEEEYNTLHWRPRVGVF